MKPGLYFWREVMERVNGTEVRSLEDGAGFVCLKMCFESLIIFLFKF